ncbi:MAG: hypothetical protein HQM10_19355 [Candidatus Riflebacteria bacterium]|nr:hypothetical protein [Candidatus Riflebacteria bacterium]
MDRVKIIFFLLILENIFIGLMFPEIESHKIIEMSAVINSLKVDIAKLERVSLWMKEAKKMLDNSPGDDPVAVLDDVSKKALNEGLEISETRNLGGVPARITFKATGKYPAAARIIFELEKRTAVSLDFAEILSSGSGRAEISVEASVRSGQWESTSSKDSMPAHEKPGELNFPIPGRKDLFEEFHETINEYHDSTQIKYQGFYFGNNRKIVIIGEKGKNSLYLVGETTLSDQKIISADEDKLELLGSDGQIKTILMSGNKK